jgi:hypothetical protein
MSTVELDPKYTGAPLFHEIGEASVSVSPETLDTCTVVEPTVMKSPGTRFPPYCGRLPALLPMK